MPTVLTELESTAIHIPIGGRTWLTAEIATPPDAKGLVLFAHGSGSSRHSPRNRYVDDPEVLQMNAVALKQLTCTKELEVIPGATHLFEEPGALEAVASAAGAWFQRHLIAGH